jgi:hypothetical protein
MRLMNRAGDTNRGNWQQEYNKRRYYSGTVKDNSFGGS